MASGLKALESATAVYLTKLISVEDTCILREGLVERGTCLTHEIVRDLDADVCRTILRVPIEGSDISSLAERVSIATVSLRGPMGWIPEIRPSVSGRPSTSSLMRSSRPSSNQRFTNEASRLVNEDKEASDEGHNNSFESLMGALDEGLRGGLLASTDRLVATLIDLVLPTIAAAYVKISRSHPQDPVQFMADFLRERGVERESQAREAAHNAFLAALDEANAREKYEPMVDTNSN